MKSITIEHISKSFKKGKTKVEALKDINLEVENGCLFGLIGPDGAGKTTLFRILTTLLLADEGKASVMGYDVVKQFKSIRKIVGYMPGKFSLYQDLSVEENLSFFATLFHTTIKANYDIIKDIYVQLEPFKRRRAGALSGGMKQKLALCCALVHRPEILFLDEPTTGVDAVSRKEFWDMLQQLKSEGITIFASTPYMDEANLCDEIALIQGGQLLSINTPEGLVNAYPHTLWAVKTNAMFKALKDLEGHTAINKVHAFGSHHHCHFITPQTPESIENYLSTKGHRDIEVFTTKATIEDCFLALMDKKENQI